MGLWWLVVIGLLSGCVLQKVSLSPVPSLPPTATPLPELVITEMWQSQLPGLEYRAYYPEDNALTAYMVALRIDPALYTFRAHYRPGQALTLEEWRNELPDALAFINANFFEANHEVVGMIVADGVVYGKALLNLGGTLQVQNGQARVRSNILEPYYGEPLEQAVQAYPMLVLNGVSAFTDTRPDRFTRRTVAGQDSSGRIVLLATPLLGLPLVDLSAYLPSTDLNLVNAFNLDGGGSTMMVLHFPGLPDYRITSIDPVPAVLAVYPR